MTTKKYKKCQYCGNDAAPHVQGNCHGCGSGRQQLEDREKEILPAIKYELETVRGSVVNMAHICSTGMGDFELGGEFEVPASQDKTFGHYFLDALRKEHE